MAWGTPLGSTIRSIRSSQSTPERTLKLTPVCTLAFRCRVVDSYSCLASHPFFLVCLGHSFLIRLCIFRRHGGLYPLVSWGNHHGFLLFCLVWLRPRFLLFRCFSSGETQIWPGDLRVVVVAGFFVLFVWFYHDLPRLMPKCFNYVVQFLPLLSLSGPSLRARSATTEEKK